MGVPKFYRWISERYPCLSEVVKEYQVPEFDNLYLDMNGIIHNCSHPNDEDPHFRITEEQIFKDIFHYIEVLFRIIRPQKTFFMAVDGVAPRAKMNQQRGRRFRSAKEAEANIKEAIQKGEVLPTEKRFDSNCITPGTKFMTKLQAQLEYFVKSKITTDTLWQGVDVYLSGHQTPGEGEHKIMEFIRHQRSQDGYNPNTRHCLYGLDADLMMLALCSHEPHFSLLREEVKFTKRKKSTKTARAEETTFHLLHISLMREYIGHEFQQLKTTLPFEFDLESIIDDWILLGFLVGNDFIPHLPDLHISTSALPYLYQSYRETLPKLDGYLNEGGTINLKRFQVFLKTISEFDLNHFEEVYSDYKWLESKTNRHKKGDKQGSNQGSNLGLKVKPCSEEESLKIVKELAIKQGTLSSTSTICSDENEDCDLSESEADDSFMQEFKLHKRAYYEDKFKVKATPEQVSSIAFEYILGLQWICHYYYNGVQSWSWYYPYHYSPYISDLKNIENMRLKFKLNKPFLPFQQLLAVLPSASRDCIPEDLWSLMEEETSPIGDFYPNKFSTDLNGKLQEWEAVVLIPFIDESRLLTAMQPIISRLKSEDRGRNQHGPCQLYQHDPSNPHSVKSSLSTLPDINLCVARRTNIPSGTWIKQNYNSYTKGLLQGCQLNVYFQGFPTLYHLPHKASLKKQGVKVFQAQSRNENMILKIVKKSEDKLNFSAFKDSTEPIEETAKRLLNDVVYVNWPHMEEAKVVAVSNQKTKIWFNEKTNKFDKKMVSHRDIEEFDGDIYDFHSRNLNQRGINIGETQVLVYAQIITGRKYICGNTGVNLVKQYSSISQPFALQAVLKDIEVQDPTFKKMESLDELFPNNSPVFHLSVPHYGSMGNVIEVNEGHVKVNLRTLNEPDLSPVIKGKNGNCYYPGWKIASMVGISSYLVSRITGTIYVYFPPTRKWNVGLNLRFSRENCGIAGFTKKLNNEWVYSETLASVLKQYLEKFPEVMKYLGSALQGYSETNLDAERMFGSLKVADKLQELAKWLKSLPCFKGHKVHESSNILETKTVEEINEKILQFKNSSPRTKEIIVEVLPVNLYRPLLQQGNLIADINTTYQLFDRVANIKEGFTVPLGLKGTIIGIHKKGNTEVLCDVLFDEEFMGGVTIGGQCPPRRGYQLPSCTLINMSHGLRCNKTINKPVAVVRPHHQQQQQVNQQRNVNQQNNQRQRMQSPNQRFKQNSPQTPPGSRNKKFVPSQNSAFRPTNKNSENAKSSPPKKILSKTSNNNNKKFPPYANDLPTPQKFPVVGNHPSGNPRFKFAQMWESFRHDKPGVSAEEESNNENLQNNQLNGNPVLSLSEAAQSLPKISTKTNDDVIINNNDVIKDDVTELTQNNVTQPNTFDLTKSLKEKLNLNPTSSRTEEPEVNEKDQFNQLIASLKAPDQPLHSHIEPPQINQTFNQNIQPFQPYYQQNNHYYQPTMGQYQPSTSQQPLNNHSKEFLLQNYLSPNSLILLRPENFVASPGKPLSTMMSQPSMMSQSSTDLQFNKEGTEKLCEILSIGNSEDKVEDNNNWSTTTNDNDEAKSSTLEDDLEHHNEDKETQLLNVADDERSTSVEDKQNSDQDLKNVPELLDYCRSLNVFPPLYTYFDDQQEVGKFRASVRLYNGQCFQSSCLDTKEKCMEEVASVALNYLKETEMKKKQLQFIPPPPFMHHPNLTPPHPPPFIVGPGGVPLMLPNQPPMVPIFFPDGSPVYPQFPPPVVPLVPHLVHQGYNPHAYGNGPPPYQHVRTNFQPVYQNNHNNHFITEPSFIPPQVMRQHASNTTPHLPQKAPNLIQPPKFILSDSPTLGKPPIGPLPQSLPQNKNKKKNLKPKPKLAISFGASKNNQ